MKNGDFPSLNLSWCSYINKFQLHPTIPANANIYL